jgi:hypothetical protein
MPDEIVYAPMLAAEFEGLVSEFLTSTAGAS